MIKCCYFIGRYNPKHWRGERKKVKQERLGGNTRQYFPGRAPVFQRCSWLLCTLLATCGQAVWRITLWSTLWEGRRYEEVPSYLLFHQSQFTPREDTSALFHLVSLTSDQGARSHNPQCGFLVKRRNSLRSQKLGACGHWAYMHGGSQVEHPAYFGKWILSQS